MTNILVQNIETFETITTHANMDAFDAWMDGNAEYGIVSLDADADGEYGWVALVAPIDGPDYDAVTTELYGETATVMVPEDEAATMNDASQEEILEMLRTDDNGLVIGSPEHKEAVAKELHDRMQAEGQAILDEWMAESEETITPAPAKPRKPRKSKKKSTPSKGAKMRNFEILSSHIESNPGVSRTDVFADAGLQSALRTKAQVAAIAKGDKAEVKRWNRRLNFLIREMRRQGVDIQIERKGRIAHYTIGKPSGQLELPFDEAAEARNATITGETVVEAPTVDPKRAEEEPNQMMDFDALLATLDEEAVAPVTK